MKTSHNKITTPPSNENVKSWIIEHYGDDFEPIFLHELVMKFHESTKYHTEYSKKKTLKYISENIFKLDRIYRKQEAMYWIKRGWDDQIAEHKRIIRNKKWYIDTYGKVEGLLKYNKKNNNISNNCGHTLDKYIDRYGHVDGPIKYDEYKKGCARNLEFFIKKYGDIVGKKKFKDFKKHIGKASKESMLIFKPLVEWLINYINKSEIYYGENDSREFFIVKNSKTYLYDFTIKSLKLIIEFNGVKFHVNENWSDDVKNKWKHPFKNMSYLDSIENDKFKIHLAKDSGFDVLVIWSDIPVEENIEICKNFITNKLNKNEIIN
jgi:very-short-patch-repair endonuclease/ribosomal protein S24E